MRTKVKKLSPETALLRVLDALAQEAIDASDEQVIEAATDLRMDLNTKDSAAYSGLTYFARPQLAEFFDIEATRRLPAPAERIVDEPPGQPRIPTERKPRNGK